jgi:hypothetical protein
MADLALGAGRHYSLVTTVIHRGPGQCKLAELDLHLTSGDLRLRFHDRPSLARFCFALGELAREAYLPHPARSRAVHTRVYTDQDEAVGTSAQSLLIDEMLGLPF